ncbi:MAG: YfaZ family outer membrane protein [Desulfosalsimonadaceae bacterium]
MKTKMKTIALLTLMFSGISVCCATASLAVDYTLKLVANQSAIESEFEALIPSFNSMVTTGVGGVYQSDDYKIAYAKALFGNEIFVRGLSGGLGLKGALGEAEKRHIEDDIASLGFTAALSYDLSKEFGPDIPVTFLSSMTLAPEPLCFSDTDGFFEFMLECDWKVLEQAAVVASYRYLNIDFKPDTNRQKIDSTGYVGLKLFF